MNDLIIIKDSIWVAKSPSFHGLFKIETAVKSKSQKKHEVGQAFYAGNMG